MKKGKKCQVFDPVESTHNARDAELRGDGEGAVKQRQHNTMASSNKQQRGQRRS